MTRYGIHPHDRTPHTEPFTVWSGAFMSELEGYGTFRDGAKSVIVHVDYLEPVRVTFPEGVTLPRTDDNYEAVDAAISDALNRAYPDTTGA